MWRHQPLQAFSEAGRRLIAGFCRLQSAQSP
jgi:hypothetical protein